jgi:hypothetical protein
MLYMVFDVESVGLQGEGFAVGWAVVDAAGHEIGADLLWTDPLSAHGSAEGQAWVALHCGPFDRPPSPSTMRVRSGFWRAWLYWKERGAVLVADCAWPVEARFLAACVDDVPADREWQGPYPLHEVATARLLAGFDPLATVDRLPSELPAHNPLADARQSARLWLEALAALGK